MDLRPGGRRTPTFLNEIWCQVLSLTGFKLILKSIGTTYCQPTTASNGNFLAFWQLVKYRYSNKTLHSITSCNLAHKVIQTYSIPKRSVTKWKHLAKKWGLLVLTRNCKWIWKKFCSNVKKVRQFCSTDEIYKLLLSWVQYCCAMNYASTWL